MGLRLAPLLPFAGPPPAVAEKVVATGKAVARALEDVYTRVETHGMHTLETKVFTGVIQSRISDLYARQAAFSARDLDHAGQSLERILDSSHWTFFTQRLAALGEKPEVRAYVRAVADAKGHVDLWQLTRRHTATDSEAIEWIAVLFQDLCVAHPGHYAELADAGFASELKGAVLSLRSAMDERRLAAFPPGTAAAEDDGLYHYYVPAYLAQELVRARVVPELAFAAAATLNLEYELYSSRLALDRKAATALELVAMIDRDTDAIVRDLRARGAVTDAFRATDLDWREDLGLDDAFLARVAERYGVDKRVLDRTNPLTAEVVARGIDASHLRARNDLGNVLATAELMLNGATTETDVDPVGQNEALLGFLGASVVLREPLDARSVREGLRADAVGYMQQLFAALAASQRDPAFELVRPEGATATVAVIDQDFSSERVAHGTAVLTAAARNLNALPIRAGIDGIVAAFARAEAAGARVVNISQEMRAASAEDVERFRAALAAHPDLLVVMAAGNNGAVVSDALDLAAVDAPNFVKVAATTRDGALSSTSSYGAAHVQFAAFADENASWRWRGSLFQGAKRAAAELLLPERQATSFAAPEIANLLAKVRVLKPRATPAEIVALVARGCRALPGVRHGVPDAARVYVLAKR